MSAAGFDVDENGLLDLSSCYSSIHCDPFKALSIAQCYYFSQMTGIAAWDGTPIAGLANAEMFNHLVCKHGKHKRGNPINPLIDLDIDRIRRLPLISRAVSGSLGGVVYFDGKRDSVLVVVDVDDFDNYVVALQTVGRTYRIKSAYPTKSSYVEKIKRRSLGSITL